MNQVFRTMLGAAVAVTIGGVGQPALAEWSPEKPISVIVPYGAGGGTDTATRALVEVITNNNLSPQPWVVENRSGGGGMVGMQFLIENEGDEHMIGVLTSSNMTSPLLQPDLGLHWSQLEPIANLVVSIQYLVTHEDSGMNTLDDFVSKVKAEPGKLRVAGAAIGNEDHLTTLMMAEASDLDVTYIPHQNGGEVKRAIAGGHVDAAWLNPGEMVGLLQKDGGTIFPIGVAWAERTPEFPAVPAFRENDMDVVFDAFFRGVFGTAGMSDDQKAFYAGVVEAATSHPDWKAKASELNLTSLYIAPAEYKASLKVWDDTLSELIKLALAAK